MNPVDHMIEADGVAEQCAVLLRVGENRQDADLVDQTSKGRLVGRQASEVAAYNMADSRYLGALVPDFTHLAVNRVGGDRKSTRLNSSHVKSRMPSSARK